MGAKVIQDTALSSRRLDCSGVKCLYAPRIAHDSEGREGPREEKRLLLVLFEPGKEHG